MCIRDRANIGETLVYARTGDNMLKRRGGFDYFLKYKAEMCIRDRVIVIVLNYVISKLVVFKERS